MSSSDVRDRLKALLPGIRERRLEIERTRRLPRALVDELSATGIFSVELPRALGGREWAPADTFQVIEWIAGADGSTGWCTALSIANNGIAGFMDEAGAKEVFTDPNAPTAGIFAPIGSARRVEGGVRITGRWPFASGITHCDWVWVGCHVVEGGSPRMTATGPEILHAFVPTREVEIHDTWFVSGLGGTGSNDISVEDVFVPERRLFLVGDLKRRRPEPLYQLPTVGAFVAHVAAVSLGIARAALDELCEVAQTKTPTFSAALLADRSVAQVELARAEASLAAARAFFYAAMDELWQAVVAGAQPMLRQIALGRIAAAHATEVGAAVARSADLLAGGSAIYAQSSFQRHMRDAEAITHHFTVAPFVWEDAGRVFMGRSPTAPMF